MNEAKLAILVNIKLASAAFSNEPENRSQYAETIQKLTIALENLCRVDGSCPR